MDISDTLVPTSTQLDAIDLIDGPVTVTVVDVKKVGGDQPIHIRLAEFERVWKPSKNVRRVLVAVWGRDASKYVGRRVTIFRDPDVKWAGKKVGGIRVSHASDIDGPLSVPQLDGQQSSSVTIQPLAESAPVPTPTGPTAEDVAAATTQDELKALWGKASPTIKELIKARKAELEASEPEQGALV